MCRASHPLQLSGSDSLITATENDNVWMLQALKLAARAAELGEVPVGALVVLNGEVIGQGYNQPIASHDPSAHAEIMALRDAAQRVGNYRLPEAELYVTLEPCMMCAGAIVHARIARVIYGATEPKAGAVDSQLNSFSLVHINHRPLVTSGVLAEACSQQLSDFFKARRAAKRSNP